MLSVHGRKPAAVVVEPVAKLFLKMGLTPNVVTIVGTLVTIAIAVICIPLDHLFAAAVLSGLFAAFDMLDGTMARMTTGGSKFGATLDASCDRITDGALFSAILYWLVYVDNARPIHVVACLIVLVSSQVISYIKARGEASGFLGGIGLEGLGVPDAIEIALWILVFGSIFTVIQRMVQAARQDTKARFTPDL